MNITRATVALGLAALTVAVSPSAAADDTGGWYVGGNIGQSRAKINDTGINSDLLGSAIATTSIANDDHDIGYKLFGGYQFIKYFAVEGGYFDLGTFGFNAATTPPGTLSGNIKLKGLNFDTVGILPITEKFSAFGRFGVNYAEAKDSFAGTGSVDVVDPSRRKRAANYKYGVGLEYDFTESFGARAEAERYRIDDAIGNNGDIDLFSAGLLYRFGRNTPPPAPPAAPPEPIIAAAPVPVAPPPPPPPKPTLPRKVAFSADSLFDFGKATVRPAGKQALDKFATDMRGATFEFITVTGYTDRIGSHEYNMKLSTRRAEAVKTYLVESAGIPPDKIVARGADGSDPETKPGECKGTKATKQLVACLQPDRRVEIEVSGTR